MPWPIILQNKTLRLDCKAPNGESCYVEMSFDGFPSDTGRYLGDYQGTIRYVAHGSSSDHGLVVVFQWEDSFVGLKGLQTIWFEDDRLLWYQGAYFTFDREPFQFGWNLQVGEMKKHWGNKIDGGSLVSLGAICTTPVK